MRLVANRLYLAFKELNCQLLVSLLEGWPLLDDFDTHPMFYLWVYPESNLIGLVCFYCFYIHELSIHEYGGLVNSVKP